MECRCAHQHGHSMRHNCRCTFDNKYWPTLSIHPSIVHSVLTGLRAITVVRSIQFVHSKQKKMSPIDDYEWCVRFLKRIFRACGQDILAAEYHRTAVMYAITISYILILLAYICTFVDTNHYDVSVRYTAASFCAGAIQV